MPSREIAHLFTGGDRAPPLRILSMSVRGRRGRVSLRLGPLAVLTVHRTVIHCRSCRFATIDAPYRFYTHPRWCRRGGCPHPPVIDTSTARQAPSDQGDMNTKENGAKRHSQGVANASFDKYKWRATPHLPPGGRLVSIQAYGDARAQKKEHHTEMVWCSRKTKIVRSS